MMQALCTDLDRAGQVAFLETDKPENPDEGHQLGGGFMVSSPSSFKATSACTRE